MARGTRDPWPLPSAYSPCPHRVLSSVDVSQFRPGRIVSLYRYPHPLLSGQWLYVGQGIKRDSRHRAGRSSFGLRFKRQFPGIPLPAPIRWEEPAADSIEANNAETVAMFRYHTWHGYPGGMNLTLPGSTDYENLGRIGIQCIPEEAKRRGRHNSGCMTGPANIRKIPREKKVSNGLTVGHRFARLGIGICGLTKERLAEAGRRSGLKSAQKPGFMAGIGRLGGSIGGRRGSHDDHSRAGLIGSLIGNCKRWNIDRGKPCTCGKHPSS